MDAGIAGILGAVLGAVIAGGVALYLNSKDHNRQRGAEAREVYHEFLRSMRELVETSSQLKVIGDASDVLATELTEASTAGDVSVRTLKRVELKVAELKEQTAHLKDQVAEHERIGRSVLDRLMVKVEPRMIDPIMALLNSVQAFQAEPTPERRAEYSDAEREFLLAVRGR